mmetsp:Transcript_37683/g.97218  ORF Transcript_37683/g.97218 Transcript_37683/m.97218 type:complete len:81 (-) Transcript_37683:443-685(-)
MNNFYDFPISPAHESTPPHLHTPHPQLSTLNSQPVAAGSSTTVPPPTHSFARRVIVKENLSIQHGQRLLRAELKQKGEAS